MYVASSSNATVRHSALQYGKASHGGVAFVHDAKLTMEDVRAELTNSQYGAISVQSSANGNAIVRCLPATSSCLPWFF